MNLIGKRGKHNKYGVGTITDVSGTIITVRFEDTGDIKKFTFKSLSENMKLEDIISSNELEKEVKKQDVEINSRKRKSGEEAVRRYVGQRNPKDKKRELKIPRFSSIEQFCEQYKQKIIIEIAYLRDNGGKKYKIINGVKIETPKKGSIIYTFDMDSEVFFPDGTIITLWVAAEKYSAQIIACEDFSIIISTAHNFGDSVSSLEFSAEPWKLLQSLNDRLDEMSHRPSTIAKMLVEDGRKHIRYDQEIIIGQEKAHKMAQSQPITFIWGPPGTGKTDTLARIALSHIAKGKRVLMLSHSNVSVDGAITRIFQKEIRHKAGRLVRFGYPKDKKILNHEYLTAYNLALRNHPNLLKEQQNLLREKEKIKERNARYVEIRKRLTQIRELLSQAEKENVQKALFVATTVSKAVADKTIYNQKFDVVIFDEASMAFVPQIAFSASLAGKYFICVGDFAQLPPIVQNEKAEMLSVDIFQYCGITEAVEHRCGHEWLCMLDTQYRMHPDVADFVGREIYNGLLKSGEGVIEERNKIAPSFPELKNAMGLIDISGMMTDCIQTLDKSRINVLSALITFSFALRAAKQYEVGIITPYSAQSRLLHAMSRDSAIRNPQLKQITCATVHQFQGSEKEVILYDAVDCFRMKYPGILLTSNTNRYADRLFNVAVTRSKGKFVAVTNANYIESKISHKLMFSKLINICKLTGNKISGEQITELAIEPQNGMQILDNDSDIWAYIEDIEKAKTEIRIDLPKNPKDEQYIILLVQRIIEAKRKGIEVSIRAELKDKLPEKLKPFAIEHNFVENPVTIIDRKIVWFGMPHSDANFISEGRTLKTKFRPIYRFEGKNTATALIGFLNMKRMIDQGKIINPEASETLDSFAKYVLAKKRCAKCGKPMKLCKGKTGKFFVGCSDYPACKYIERVDTSMVDDYLMGCGENGLRCPQDGLSLEAAKGPYGVYVRCCAAFHKHIFKLDQI